MLKGLISALDKSISETGMVLTMKNIVKKCNTEVVIKSNKEIDMVLEKFSGVVVANHPAEADVLAILSAVKNRKDVFLIINSQLREIIPKLDNYLIPVYINNYVTENFEGKIKTKLLGFFKKIPKYSKEEEHQKNIESIKMAIEKIDQGGLVIIFPNGGGQKHDWFNGVGHLIHGIKDKKKSFVIRANIKGTSNFDYLRLLPIIGRFLPKFRISFAKPLRVNTIIRENPKATTLYLENKYWKWMGSVQLWTKLSKSYLWLRILFIFLINKPY